MSTTTANMGLTKPDLNADPGVWDTHINASLDRVDIHTHAAGLGVPVPTAGLNINANLTMAGHSLTNLRAASFAVQVAPAAAVANLSFWCRSSNNEIYFRDATGTDHQWSSGGALNLSATGGIIGDYAASVAAVYYDDTAQEYRFLEAVPAPNSWSYVGAGGLRIYEHASGISNRVSLLSPTALAASYSLTLPAALPGSTQILQVSSAGAITASNTVANLITASAGMTAAVDQHVTISGTGRFKHGDLVRGVNAAAAGQLDANWTLGIGQVTSTAAAVLYVSIPFDEGARVKSLTFARFGDGAANYVVDVYSVPTDVAAATNIGTSTTTPAASWGDTTIDITDTTIGSGGSIVIRFSVAASTMRVGNVRITWDRP